MQRKHLVTLSLIVLLLYAWSMLCFSHDHEEHDDHDKPEEITLTPESIKQNNIHMSKAEPKLISKQLEVIGKITPNRDTMAFIYPRYDGIVKVLKKNLGETAQAQETLAVIESNESLQSYDLKSPITGTIIKKNAAQGELVKGDRPIYEIANLDTVWVDLSVFCKDAPCVTKGQPVVISDHDGKLKAEGIINYLAPIGIEDNQTMMARVVLPNNDGRWIPGMYVDVAITIEKKQVPVAVNRGAIQKINNVPVVFIQTENHFKPIPVQLGMGDKNNVEIISGIKAGQAYVSSNSFLLKADLGKNEADHDD